MLVRRLVVPVLALGVLSACSALLPVGWTGRYGRRTASGTVHTGAALRHLGTARTGAYLVIAPFVGALLASPTSSPPPRPPRHGGGRYKVAGPATK